MANWKQQNQSYFWLPFSDWRRLTRVSLSAVIVCCLISGVWLSAVGAVGQTYKIMSTPENVIWGELFKPDSRPIARVKSGDRVVVQTISHEGILPDQGDTMKFFAQGGIPQLSKTTTASKQVLPDQLRIKAAVKQVVDIVKGIHGTIPKQMFSALKPEKK